jgi:hypothetical protein
LRECDASVGQESGGRHANSQAEFVCYFDELLVFRILEPCALALDGDADFHHGGNKRDGQAEHAQPERDPAGQGEVFMETRVSFLGRADFQHETWERMRAPRTLPLQAKLNSSP